MLYVALDVVCNKVETETEVKAKQLTRVQGHRNNSAFGSVHASCV